MIVPNLDPNMWRKTLFLIIGADRKHRITLHTTAEEVSRVTLDELDDRFSRMQGNTVQCLVDLHRKSKSFPDVFTALEA